MWAVDFNAVRGPVVATAAVRKVAEDNIKVQGHRQSR